MANAHMLMILLIRQVQREKHAKTFDDLNSKLTMT